MKATREQLEAKGFVERGGEFHKLSGSSAARQGQAQAAGPDAPAHEDVKGRAVGISKGSRTARIRQSSKPLLNKLELEALIWLQSQDPDSRYHSQAIRLRLANGLTYTPDFVSFDRRIGEYGPPRAYEVKGPHAWDDAIAKLKMAASVFPEIRFWLLDKVDGVWRTQLVMA